MRTPARDAFVTVHTEGGLLPTDLLSRIATGDRTLEGVTSEAYHLSGERLSDAINRSWSRLAAAWNAFGEARAKLAETDPGTSLTRERWLLVLFETLGYGRLSATKTTEIDGKPYPISHFWRNVPIHLVGFRVHLERRAPGVAGAARTHPHGLVQEFLNRSAEHRWGFVSNGLSLRLLRDNSSLTRQAFVEFDLEAMMEGQAYADFVLLWLLCHESRLEAEKPEDLWLERWAHAAREQGTRALDTLRAGVEEAIRQLGSGFLAHPANAELKSRLRSGVLTKEDYYRQCLRLVYRLLFLFVAEDRDHLLDTAADAAARGRYLGFYSTAHLRRLALRRRGTRHADLYRAFRLVMERLGADEGAPALALPALGLWSREAIPDIAGGDLSNERLLAAIRALAFTEQERRLRAVDYRNLGSEELGSIYESLLELHPEINADAATFELRTAAGHERKTTGSYYTPSSLIQCLLDSALEPVLDEASRKPEPEKAILALKVCDPACGSGHFLIAAAHKIARRLASVRSGGEEPAPEATRGALRDVISRCIYGVDVNPMAVELCKVSLWMEAMEPGKPLAFLDHRILCGNSLIGVTPKLIEEGVPDDAFEAVEGDEKEIARSLKRQNRAERSGQMALPLVAMPQGRYGGFGEVVEALDAIDDDSISSIHEKESHLRRLGESEEYLRAQLVADGWCAAFMWEKRRGTPAAVTHDTLLRLKRGPEGVSADVRAEIAGLALEYRFFHWHLAFPDVFRVPAEGAPENAECGWSGGFDLVLGNPPWDTLSPDVKEFFSAYDARVRFQDREGQQRIVTELLEDPEVATRWQQHCRALYLAVHFFKQSGRYVLFAPGNLGKGDFNVYRMFVETAFGVIRDGGWAAQVAPEGLYNGANAMAIRKTLLESFRWERLFGFENAREIWFKGIDTRTKFCIYAARKGGATAALRVSFNIRTLEGLREAQADGLEMPVPLIAEFSPDALAIMEFSDQREIDIARKMYARWPKFGDESAGEPHREYMAEVHMGNDRDLFDDDPSGLPVYEGRMVNQWDYRAKGYRSGRGRAAVWEELPFGSPTKSIQPQWHIPRDRIPGKTVDRVEWYRVGFCDVGSPTNERTLIASLIPAGCICGHSVPTFCFGKGFDWAYMVWLAVANSFAMDFVVRQKAALHLTYTMIDSLPFPSLPVDDPRLARIVAITLRLTCTGPEMIRYWNAMAKHGWVEPIATGETPSGYLDEEQRLVARAELSTF